MAVGLLYSLWSERPAWSDLALLLVLAVAVRLTWQGWAVAAPAPLRWPALAFGAAHVLTAALSTDTATSWRAVVGLAAYGLVFMLAGNVLAAGVTRGQLYRALVLTAQVLVAAMLAGWLADGARLWGYRVRFEANNTAALMALLLMPALVVGECRRLVIGQAVAVAWLTASRSGALGMLAGLVTAAPLATVPARYWRWGVVIGLVLMLALASRAGRDLLTANGRAEMWTVAGRMFADSPLWGQGPNTYKAHWLAAGPWEYAFGHAHNLYLNVAAETGMIGLAAGGWLMWAVLRSLSSAGSMSGSMWPRAALAATVALLAHSLGDTPTTAPYIVVAWLALVRIGLHEPA